MARRSPEDEICVVIKPDCLDILNYPVIELDSLWYLPVGSPGFDLTIRTDIADGQPRIDPIIVCGPAQNQKSFHPEQELLNSFELEATNIPQDRLFICFNVDPT